MEPTDAKTFGMSLDQLGAIFNVELTLPKKHGYWIALEDLPLEAVQYACKQALKTESFMPVPALLRTYAKEWARLARDEQRAQSPLALREDLVSQEEVRRLLASVWPEERERWAKDPIPPYEQKET